MENRLNLNKKPTYKLPNEVLIREYREYSNSIPKFEPNLVINNWGQHRFCSFGEKYERSRQLWIKTENKELLSFLKEYDYNKFKDSTRSPFLKLWSLKKIILEEFYRINQ